MENTLKTVYWFAYYGPESPSVRYRGLYPCQRMREKGIRTHICYPGYSPKRIIRFIFVFSKALFARKNESLIVIQRVHSNRIYANLLKLLTLFSKAKIAYDLDDADYLVYAENNIEYFLSHSDFNLIGSQELNQYAQRFNQHSFHLTSPTYDLQRIKKKKNECLHVGWVGCYGGGHEETLVELVFPAIRELSFPIRFSILGVQTNENMEKIKNLFVDSKHVMLCFPSINWLNESEVQNEIVKFDLGIATLKNDELHRSKSAFKLKQYLNNGIPVLSSPIGENQLFIEDGVNGFFCNTSDEFHQKISFFQDLASSEYAEFSENAKLSSEVFEIESYIRQVLTTFRHHKNRTSETDKKS